MSKILSNRALSFREMFEQIFPYPDNITPLLIYRKSMRETPTTPKRKLERKQSPSYRSMEKQML